MQRQRLFTITSLLLFVILLTFGLGINAQDTQPVFRIGVLDDERGPIASGAQLAVRQINAQGGVEGADGTLFRLELVIESTAAGNSLEDAVEALDAASVVAVLGPENTDELLSHLPILQSLGVPILTPAIGDTVIASDTTGLLFRMRAAERLHGSAITDYLVTDLNVRTVTTVQLDRASTASRVGFSFALGHMDNAPLEETLLMDSSTELTDLVSEVASSATPVVVLYGSPVEASIFYQQLRSAGWVGKLVYDQALNPAFMTALSLEELNGIVTVSTWPLAAGDILSQQFRDDFVTILGRAPGPIEAASYDAITLIAAAIRQPGSLVGNLTTVREVAGVQGILNPPSLASTRGEISDSLAVVELNALGGTRVVVRYAGIQRLPNDLGIVIVDIGTQVPSATPTPDGVIITIESSVQNVRTGPGMEYPVLGQLRQGEQARVIGATIDFSWVVIEFRGQQGWLATYLLDVFGDRSDVPVVAIPPTPTPGPATNTPAPPAIPDIVILSVSPSVITRGTATNVSAIVRNQGGAAAGPFAVAATFPPSSSYAAANIDGLAAGAEIIIQLPVTLTGATGNYQVAIVADLNRQVDEGSVGENNNIFNLNYRLDQVTSLINSTTLGSGSSVDLDPTLTISNDISYTGAGLQTVGTCDGTRNCIGLLSPSLTWETAHFDAITASNGINAGFISNAALAPGTTVGVLTNDGLRGVLRIDAIQPGVSITFTYRIYQNPSP